MSIITIILPEQDDETVSSYIIVFGVIKKNDISKLQNCFSKVKGNKNGQKWRLRYQ